MNRILYVESSNIANIIKAEFMKLGIDDVGIRSTNGHLFDYHFCPHRGLSLTPTNPEILAVLKSDNGKNIIIATDPDEQGELIAAHIKFLTPDASHRRMVINDLSPSGIIKSVERFNNHEFHFDESSASKAALKKIINLKMRYDTYKSGFIRNAFITTTSIEIAKQCKQHGSIDRLLNVPILVEGAPYTCIVPSDKSDLPVNFEDQLSLAPATPCTTADLIRLNALSSFSSSTIEQLQQSFTEQRISYPRTTATKLPQSASDKLRYFTLNGGFILDTSAIEDDPACSHYALYNTAKPKSFIEKQIALQNRRALGDETPEAIIRMKYRDQPIVAYRGKVLSTAIESSLPPENALRLNLLHAGSAVSTIDRHAQNYKHYFYGTGAQINHQLMSEIAKRAERYYPKIWTCGIDALVNHVLNISELDQPQIDNAITTSDPHPKQRIEDAVHSSMMAP